MSRRSENRNPVDLLARAARLVRERAEAATSGPWTPERRGVRDADGVEFVEATRDDTPHIALWHPGVAFAVAGWLEHEAGMARDAENRHRLLDHPLEYPHEVLEAVAVARALTGEAGQ